LVLVVILRSEAVHGGCIDSRVGLSSRIDVLVLCDASKYDWLLLLHFLGSEAKRVPCVDLFEDVQAALACSSTFLGLENSFHLMSIS